MLSRRVLIRSVAAAPLLLAPGLANSRTSALADWTRPDPRIGCRLPDAVEAIARRGLERHAGQVRHRDLVAIADFDRRSAEQRFLLVDMRTGRATRHLVSHGRGSDPDHRGWVQRFSNEPGSLASSDGAYLTADYYDGRHGASQRLIGLDPGNSNAEARAIVIHGAWYVSEEQVRVHGKIGRSEGCFAFSEASLDEVLTRLGPGRLLLAGRFAVA